MAYFNRTIFIKNNIIPYFKNLTPGVTTNLALSRLFGWQYLSGPKFVNISAPDGCVQYYQGVTGTIMSLNYMEAAGKSKMTKNIKKLLFLWVSYNSTVVGGGRGKITC